MSIQTRKLNVIHYIINLDDENEFQRIETQILKNKKPDPKTYIPITQDELLARAKESMEEYKKGDYFTQEDVENESETW